MVRARHEPVTVISGPRGAARATPVAAIAADAVPAAARSWSPPARDAAEVVSACWPPAGPDPVRFGQAHPTTSWPRPRAWAPAARDPAGRTTWTRPAPASGWWRGHRRGPDRRAAGRGRGRWDGLVVHLGSLWRPGRSSRQRPGRPGRPGRPRPRRPGPGRRGWWRAGGGPGPAAPGAGAGRRAGDAARRPAHRAHLRRRPAGQGPAAATGGTVLAPTWDQLSTADAALRLAAGRLVEALGAAEDRAAGAGAAIGDLATALRAGRRQRRRLLQDIDGARVVAASRCGWAPARRGRPAARLPGPVRPGRSWTRPARSTSRRPPAPAAGPPGRGGRRPPPAPPRVVRVRRRGGAPSPTTGWQAGRPGSTCAGPACSTWPRAAATTWLDEHYRSVPHLIEFSARRFYDGRLHVATRHPANEAADVIDVVRPGAGGRDWRPPWRWSTGWRARGCTDIAWSRRSGRWPTPPRPPCWPLRAGGRRAPGPPGGHGPRLPGRRGRPRRARAGPRGRRSRRSAPLRGGPQPVQRDGHPGPALVRGGDHAPPRGGRRRAWSSATSCTPSAPGPAGARTCPSEWGGPLAQELRPRGRGRAHRLSGGALDRGPGASARARRRWRSRPRCTPAGRRPPARRRPGGRGLARGRRLPHPVGRPPRRAGAGRSLDAAPVARARGRGRWRPRPGGWRPPRARRARAG